MSGIECPRCGCQHLPVIYTRQRHQYIVRMRQCRHCGRRIRTREKISEEKEGKKYTSVMYTPAHD